MGDRVTFDARPEDPVELVNHRHAVVVAVERTADGPRYMIGHPPAPRQFGPYPERRLTSGWTATQ